MSSKSGPDVATATEKDDSIISHGRRPGGRSFARQLIKVAKSRVAALLAFDLIFILIVGSFVPTFAHPANLRVLLDGMAPQAIVAAAMAALLAAGRFDLSVDGVAALSGILVGKMMLVLSIPVAPAVVLGVLFGAGVGFLQGVAVERLNFNPVVISLALWWITTGVAFGLVENSVPAGFPAAFGALGQTRIGGLLIYDYYALAIVPVIAVILTFTKFGYHVFATGGDREASRLKGVRVERVGIALYALTAAAAAFAGIIFAARIDSAQPNALDNMALNVIAAAIIGGAALTGGRASIFGAMLGLFLLLALSNAAIFLGISPLWQKAISGTVLAAAVTADAFSERTSGGRRRRSFVRRIRRRLSFQSARDAEAIVDPEA